MQIRLRTTHGCGQRCPLSYGHMVYLWTVIFLLQFTRETNAYTNNGFLIFPPFGTQSFTLYTHIYAHTYALTPPLNLRSQRIQPYFRGRQGQGSLLPAVGIYVVSLFNLIALKTSGGRHAFFGMASIPGKHPSHVYTNATHTQTHIHTLHEHYVVCSKCTDTIKGAVSKGRGL